MVTKSFGSVYRIYFNGPLGRRPPGNPYLECVMTLEQAIEIIKRKGRIHEFMWRLIVDHGYTYKDINVQVLDAWKYWDKHVNTEKKKKKK